MTVETRFEEIDVTDENARRAVHSYFAELDARFPSGFDGDAYHDEDAETMRPPGGCFVVIRSSTGSTPSTSPRRAGRRDGESHCQARHQ